VESRPKVHGINGLGSRPDLENHALGKRRIGKAGYAFEKRPAFSLFSTAHCCMRREDRFRKVQAAGIAIKTKALRTILF
jgi:hypothetical protein